MIRRKNQRDECIIDLDGPDGNVFVLMRILSDTFKRSGLDPSRQIEAMMSSDYLNAIKVFNDCLGGTFTLVTNNQSYIDVLEQRRELSKIKHSEMLEDDLGSIEF